MARECDIENETRCDNGRCIPSEWLCDHYDDCGDLSDERCFDDHCLPEEFRCQSGHCIPFIHHCNNVTDCIDMSDELDCHYGSTRMILNEENNNKTNDIDDGNLQARCPTGQFMCHNGLCISELYHCDNDNDCGDWSDEKNCASQSCTKQEFRCRSGQCIRNNLRCDGDKDCYDNSDEEECFDNSECTSGNFRCRDGTCISINNVCDGAPNCPDGSDEDTNSTCIANIMACHESGFPCQHICVATTTGHYCACKDGYRKANSTILVNNYAPLSLNKLSSEIDSINTTFIDSLNSELIHNDYHYKRNLYFWTNTKTRKIFSASVEINPKDLIASNYSSLNHQLPLLPLLPIMLQNVKPIIEIGIVEPSSIAVDWINDRIYWTDSGTSRIEYCNIDGSNRKVMFTHSVEIPKSIVVNPDKKAIYWSDWGQPVRIESSFMDGSARKTIISALLMNPTGLTIDYPANKLYWIDIKQNLIECSNLDGSNRYTIVHDDVQYPISLTIFEDNLYWTGVESTKINIVNKLSGKLISKIVVTSHDNSTNDRMNINVKVFHPLRQPDIEFNICQSHTCSDICLPNNNSYRCLCPFGFSFIDQNSKKCKKDSDSLLLFTRRNEIRAINLSKRKLMTEQNNSYEDFNLDYVLPILRIAFVVSMDYDWSTSTIFWADLLNKSINSAHWTGLHQQVIISSSLEAPSGIAYDWITKNIYWVDTGRNVIEVSKMDGSFRSLVIWRSLDQPRDIVLDPQSSLMFWSQWNNHTANIERSGMDGLFRMKIHSTNLTRPHGLAIDYTSKRLYWTDSSKSRIEYSFYDGSERRALYSANIRQPFAIAIKDELVYWSDLYFRNIQQANKITGRMSSIVSENLDNLMDMFIFQYNHSSSREFRSSIRNNCHRSNCSHLCVLSNNQLGYKCLCPIGIRLFSDNITCASDMQKYLIMTTRNDIKRISLDTEYRFDVRIPLNRRLSNAFVLDIHFQSDTVYWSDTNENVIYKSIILGGKIEKILNYGLSGVNGLAIDNVGHKIYWTDAGRKRIEVANLDGTFRKVLLSKDLDSPRAIALNNKSGHMVWADWGSQVRIERADMDGKKRALIVNENLGWPNGITFTKYGRIIWTDSKTHTIEIVDLNGSNRRIIIKDLPSPY
ncbi:low density lipoprotein receptor-like protein, partial [Euroglyphus maynei]